MAFASMNKMPVLANTYRKPRILDAPLFRICHKGFQRLFISAQQRTSFGLKFFTINQERIELVKNPNEMFSSQSEPQ